MNQDFKKELRRAEREKEQARRVESFWDAFRLTENGHVKSTLLLNSSFWQFTARPSFC